MAGESPFFERLAAGDVERLARVLARMPNLESLDLAGGFMGNEAAEVLCSSLAAGAGRGLRGWVLGWLHDNTPTHPHTHTTHTHTHTHRRRGPALEEAQCVSQRPLSTVSLYICVCVCVCVCVCMYICNLCVNDLSQRSRSVSLCVP